jgi:hypothetical protein
MPLYEMTPNDFRPLVKASFADLRIMERADLQRLLRKQIGVLGDDLYILAEEFGDWEDSRRRIDLLAIDQTANLVVIELKRTSDGGHMELQAIRYASMVSTMTFDRAVQIHAGFLASIGEPEEQAQDRMLSFLGWEQPDEETFAADVRILLVSEDFGKEITTAVLWLRDRDIDIRCVRIIPYDDGNRRLVDVHQIIPLPEANDYQVQLREKDQVGRRNRTERSDVFLRFWESMLVIARSRNLRHANLSPQSSNWIRATAGFSGIGFVFSVTQSTAVSECYIDRRDAAENKRIFDFLHSRKEQVEMAFGGPLGWERLDSRQGSRIRYSVNSGGYRSPEANWPTIQSEMVDAMIRLDAALLPHLALIDQESQQ